MRKTLLILCAVLLTGHSIFAQTASPANFGKNWLNGAVMKFQSTFNTNGTVTNTKWDSLQILEFDNGHSCISDSFGNLVLSTNGGKILNKQANIIQDGDFLLPSGIYNTYGGAMPLQQASIILPMPDSQYYIPVTTYSDSQWYNLNNNLYDGNGNINEQYIPADLLVYHKVDMRSSINNGLGKVVKKMDTLIYNNTLVYTQMTAVRHGNGRDWWLVKQAHDTNLIYTFLFTPDSIYGPNMQGFSQPHFGLFHLRGQSVFNKDGNRYATTNYGASKIFTADFDRCSGLFSNPQSYDVPCSSTYNLPDSSITECEPAGLAFSPNSQFLYVNKYYSIQQFDLLDPNPATQWYIAAWPDTTYAAFQGYLTVQLAPNNKLYIGNYNGFSGSMSVIDNPDVKGAGSNFCPKCLDFPPVFFQGQPYNMAVTNPPNMPHYELGTYFPCDTLGGATGIASVNEQRDFQLYPNPTTGNITIQYSLKANEQGMLQITDLMGRSIQRFILRSSSSETTIDLSRYASGIYLCKYFVNGYLQETGKIIITE